MLVLWIKSFVKMACHNLQQIFDTNILTWATDLQYITFIGPVLFIFLSFDSQNPNHVQWVPVIEIVCHG